MNLSLKISGEYQRMHLGHLFKY